MDADLHTPYFGQDRTSAYFPVQGGLDWGTGTYMPFRALDAAEPTAESRCRVVIAGDWYPNGGLGEQMRDAPEVFYGEMLGVLRAHDLRIINVESVIGEPRIPIPKDGPCLCLSAADVASLQVVPWHLATLSNNHVLDFGDQGLKSTIEALRCVGIDSVGAGLETATIEVPYRTEISRVKVAIVNAGEAEEARSRAGRPGARGLCPQTVGNQVHALRDDGYVVICVVHAGIEYAPVPPPYIQRWFRHLAIAGAHCVIGHHPHCPQGVEVFRGCPIAYSTGNFFFPMERSGKTRQGYLVSLELAPQELISLKLIPYVCEPSGFRVLDHDGRRTFFDELESVSDVLSDPSKSRAAWDALADELGPVLLAKAKVSLGTKDTTPPRLPTFRNLLVTDAHRRALVHFLNRRIEGREGTAPEWAHALLGRWQTCDVAPKRTAPLGSASRTRKLALFLLRRSLNALPNSARRAAGRIGRFLARETYCAAPMWSLAEPEKEG